MIRFTRFISTLIVAAALLCVGTTIAVANGPPVSSDVNVNARGAPAAITVVSTFATNGVTTAAVARTTEPAIFTAPIAIAATTSNFAPTSATTGKMVQTFIDHVSAITPSPPATITAQTTKITMTTAARSNDPPIFVDAASATTNTGRINVTTTDPNASG